MTLVPFQHLHPMAQAIVSTHEDRKAKFPGGSVQMPEASPARTTVAHSVRLACRFWHNAEMLSPEQWAELGIQLPEPVYRYVTYHVGSGTKTDHGTERPAGWGLPKAAK